MQRLLDILLSLLALVLLAPLMLMLAVFGTVFMGSPIFSQMRVGLNGRPFKLYKFRSLPMGTEDMPTHMLDPTYIPVFGRLLRGSKLDELPQLWCVVKGEMSLVGPRPGLISQRELYDARNVRGVLRLRPGITGLSQIYKIDMSTPVKLARVDAIMARNMTLCTYLLVLTRTFLGYGLGDRVRQNQ